MKRRTFITKDGSSSIYVENLEESYHSHFGALAESLFIFIESGLKYSEANPVNILEIGFGTGLNALLTLDEAVNSKRKTNYYTIEKYPLSTSEWESLNYPDLSVIHNPKEFEKLHNVNWSEWHNLNDYFSLFKSKTDLHDFSTHLRFDIIYFDAFSPEIQPDLWTEEIFSKLYRLLNPKGLLLTYSVKGTVKRALKSAGFHIKRIPGPEGKRVIMRARI
ncbi:MAG: tRNA (5-methylaminomethyl-2-thiouridine)(34)-methyltransferase MnmD [Bacteroidales bacterium]|nr:tRNA (5-methylaminomethyl-2-thiouridine)(34)-methyltransferase MnmD [Bacteroidales bacterium]